MRLLGLLLLLVLLSLAPAPDRAARAGAITFNTAITLSSNEWVWREQVVFGRASGDPTSADRTRDAASVVSVLGYGVNRKLSVFAVVPYRDTSLTSTVAGARVGRSARGLGDIRLFGRYTILRRDWLGGMLRVSPILGLELPTGRSRESDAFGRKPPGVQPGSGSWDPFAGIAVSYQTFDFVADATLSYQANTRAGGVDLGDLARLDGSFQYRLLPRELGDGVPSFLYGVIEANLIHRGRNRVAGAANRNSGGTTLFLTPGLQYVTRRLVLEAAVQVPVLQSLNGTALESDYVVRAGFRVNF